MAFTAEDAILLTVRISGIGVVITSLEFVFRPGVVSPQGLMSWKVSRVDKPRLIAGTHGRLIDAAFGPGLRSLLWCRVAVGLLCVVAPRQIVLAAPVVVAAALLSMAISARSAFGLNGADQVNTVVYGGLALVSLHRTAATEHWYILFLAAQCCLAYGIAGVAKARSPVWRDGSGLRRILGVRNYVGPHTAHFADQHPSIVLLLSWGVIFWECSFWTVLFLPAPLALVMLGAGMLFHIFIGFVMGLNDFIWAFLSLYPALLYLTLH